MKKLYIIRVNNCRDTFSEQNLPYALRISSEVIIILLDKSLFYVLKNEFGGMGDPKPVAKLQEYLSLYENKLSSRDILDAWRAVNNL